MEWLIIFVDNYAYGLVYAERIVGLEKLFIMIIVTLVFSLHVATSGYGKEGIVSQCEKNQEQALKRSPIQFQPEYKLTTNTC